MANLLAKFRIDYSSLLMVQISDKPRESTVEFFNTLIADFRTDDEVSGQGNKIKVCACFFMLLTYF